MNSPLLATARADDSARAAIMQSLGFSATGPREYRRENITFHEEPRWLVWERTVSPTPPPSFGCLGQPGLWAPLGANGNARWAMEVPRDVVAETVGRDANGDGDSAPLRDYLDWVLASANGERPPGWAPPERRAVEAWLEGESLTVRRGPLVRQGELVLSETRWALRCPVHPALPAVFPDEREFHLRELVRETQSAWRMIRLGFTNAAPTGRGLVAEADFSGAPHVRSLFLAGLDALRHVVRALAETADLLADVSVRIRSLESRATTTTKTKEEP